MKKKPLTDIQKEVIKLTTQFYKKHGYPCSQKWLREQRGISHGTIYTCIESLVKQGYLLKNPDGKPYPVLGDK